MLKSNALIVFSMIVGIVILSMLGAWQVRRLHWKENLISYTRQRASAEPIDLAAAEKMWAEKNDVNYVATKLTGTYDHSREMYYFNTWKGKSGWNIITPMTLPDKRILLVNRGFVPSQLRDVSKRQQGQIKGEVTIKGLARNPITTKPNRYVPDNQPEKREFFWKNFPQMAALASNTPDKILPFMVDAGKNPLVKAYPLGGTTRMHFPNNHLQYAITWYGLALSLFGVGSIFLYGRIKRDA